MKEASYSYDVLASWNNIKSPVDYVRICRFVVIGTAVMIEYFYIFFMVCIFLQNKTLLYVFHNSYKKVNKYLHLGKKCCNIYSKVTISSVK